MYLRQAIVLDPKDGSAYLALTSALRRLGNAELSAKYANDAKALLPPDDWYDHACLESVQGNIDNAFERLRQAAKQEDFDSTWAWEDPDLEWIRDDPRFREVVGPPPELPIEKNQRTDSLTSETLVQ